MLNPQIAIPKNVPWIKNAGSATHLMRQDFSGGPCVGCWNKQATADIQIDSFDFLHLKTPVP